MDGEAVPLDAGLGRLVGEIFERFDEGGATVGVAGIIERVDADEQVVRARRLGPGEREAQEHRVARGDVGDGNALAHPVLGHVDIVGERAAAEGRQVERQDDVPIRKRGRDAPGGLQLDAVALVIVDRERKHLIALLARQRGTNHRIQPSRQEDDGFLLLTHGRALSG